MNAPQLVAIALGCLCAGVAFSHLMARIAPASRLQEASFAESALFATSDEPLQQDERKAHAAAAAAIETPTAKPSAHPSRGSHGRHPAAHHFHAGGVVYSGCEPASGHAACPHDHAFEVAVWRTLKLLSSCYVATPDNGHAELHVIVHRNHPLEIALASPAHGRSLNLRAVGQCAAARLSKLRSHLKLERVQIIFRFGLS